MVASWQMEVVVKANLGKGEEPTFLGRSIASLALVFRCFFILFLEFLFFKFLLRLLFYFIH